MKTLSKFPSNTNVLAACISLGCWLSLCVLDMAHAACPVTNEVGSDLVLRLPFIAGQQVHGEPGILRR